MSSRRQRKTRKLILIFISCFVLGIGYYFLNVVSRIQEVLLGAVFHIVFGCFLMAIAGVYIAYTLKKMLFPKKRKKNQKNGFSKMHIKINHK